MLYYAKSTGGFYDSAVNGDAIPADAVQITTEEHGTLMASQAAGKIITADDDGKPVATDHAPLSTDQRAAAVRSQRDKLLDSTQWMIDRHRDQVDFGIETTLTADQYKGLQAFRQALRDLPKQSGFPDVAVPDPLTWRCPTR